MQFLYRIIYNRSINSILLWVNKRLSHITNLRLPPAGIIDVKLKSGNFKFSTNQTNTTSQLIYWEGVYQIEYTAIFEDLIKKCNCFFDIGAHAGYYSLIAATVNKNIKVVAFEPASGPFHYLLENIKINHFQNRISAVQIALGDFEGTTDFLEVVHPKYRYLKHNLIAVSNLVNAQVNRKMKSLNVNITTLDSYVKSNSELQPDIIKMDTEGTENLILKGANDVLSLRPVIICETLFDKIESELEKIMKAYGYEFYNFKNGYLYHVKSLERQQDNGVHDCFFVHPSKSFLIKQYLVQ